MKYLEVPNSNIKLTDGSVVVLSEDPSTKWVVHYGEYYYEGSRDIGWYFSSLPAQIIIPVTDQNLQSIKLIDQGGPYEFECPSILDSNMHPSNSADSNEDESESGEIEEYDLDKLTLCGPDFVPFKHCRPPRPCPPPGPCPPPIPPIDNCYPSVNPPSYFSKSDQYLLDSSWITLPSLEYRDLLPNYIEIPDGKVVKVVDADGSTKYYSWNAADQAWDEKFFEIDVKELLDNYYTKDEIDDKLDNINNDISSVNEELTDLNDNMDDLTSRVVILEEAVFPEARPTISQFVLVGVSTIAEVGSQLTVSSFSHLETVIENIEGNLVLKHGPTMIDDTITPVNTLTSVTLSSPLTVTKTTTGTETFTLQGITTSSNTISRSVDISFYFPKFLGCSPSTSVTGSDILMMTRGPSIPTRITLSETSYIYFVTDGTISVIKDSDTGFGVPVDLPDTVEVDINSVLKNYHVYRTSNAILPGTYSFTIS